MAIYPGKPAFEFCRKKDEFDSQKKPIVYDATPALLSLPEMFPCTLEGEFLLESRIQMGAGALRSPEQTHEVQMKIAAQNLAKALGVDEQEAMALMRGDVEGDGAGADAALPTGTGALKAPGADDEEPLPAPRMWQGKYVSRLNKEELVAYALETFGPDKAGHLDAETMKSKVIVDQVERLQAEADLAAKRGS